MYKILVTGAAGFIGAHLSKRLLVDGHSVIGIDNMNHYYDIGLKRDRMKHLMGAKVKMYEEDISDTETMHSIFKIEKPDVVVNLAAQAGVRHSLEYPHEYIKSNIDGFLNILEECRSGGVKHLIYASSSSVYGANSTPIFKTTDNIDHPLSLYAATKKSNELMAHTYSHLYQLPTTGLRFFTVYGPWGRPDMALFKFTEAILKDKPIDIYNYGDMGRDFTYVNDIAESVARLVDKPAAPDKNWDGSEPDPSSSRAPYKIYNIGSNHPISLMKFIKIIEKCTGRKAKKNYVAMQPGDVKSTHADVQKLYKEIEFKPETNIEEGIEAFVKWYKDYYK